MTQWFEKYREKDTEGYTDEDGCYHETLNDFITVGVLGFYGCGMPEEAMKFVRNGLEYIQWRIKSEVPFSEKEKKEKEVFGNQQIAYFFYYWADKERLTEHGGSVPGWLDKKGEQLLEALQALNLDEE